MLAVLRAANAARGLAIDATTAFPRWDGAPLDAHLAVQALLAATGFAATEDSALEHDQETGIGAAMPSSAKTPHTTSASPEET